jgi:uncharacterized protein (TIGR03083 family)
MSGLAAAEELGPGDLIAAAALVREALEPVADRDWAVTAGPLEWDVADTVSHMIGAAGKYTLYLASRSDRFIAVRLERWPDATNAEVLDSIEPVAAGLAAVAQAVPAEVLAYHVTGPTSPAGFIGKACVEFLAHTDDVLAGFGLPFAPPAGLCRRVLAHQYPDQVLPPGAEAGEAWPALLRATGRQVR